MADLKILVPIIIISQQFVPNNPTTIINIQKARLNKHRLGKKFTLNFI